MCATGFYYKGFWKNDLKDGYGIEICPGSHKYIGDYKEGMKHGKGA